MHPSTFTTKTSTEGSREGNLQHEKLAHLSSTADHPLPRLYGSSSLFSTVHSYKQNRRLKTSWFSRSEKSFGFLQVHLLPAGQAAVLLSVHVQAFLWEQQHNAAQSASSYTTISGFQSSSIHPAKEHTHAAPICHQSTNTFLFSTNETVSKG